MATRKKRPPGKLVHEFVDLAHLDSNIPAMEAMLEEHPALLDLPRPGRDKERPLGAALHSRALGVVDFLLARGVERDVYVACVQDDVEAVAAALDATPKLLRKGAKYIHGLDLMDLAPSEEMFRLLRDRGYPMDVHIAANKGRLDELARLLEEDPARLEARDREGSTPLFSAIWGQDDAAARLLMERGCAIDTPNDVAPPLTYAVIWGMLATVRELVARGTDVHHHWPMYGFSHLHTACNWGLDVGMGILDKASYTRAILEVIDLLLEEGVDAGLQDAEGRTAEELAEANGVPERAVRIRARLG